MPETGAMQIEWDVAVAMDDGVELRADVFRPRGGEPVPAIASYGPYAKGLPTQVGYPEQWRRMCADHPDIPAGSSNAYQTWELCDPEKWVPHGYAVVRFDSRGAGASPGYLDPFSPRETRDLHDCIEWIAAQSWCSGKVGLNGISYFAMNQWHVAGLAPPHLAAMVAWEGSGDFYREFAYHGGILCEFALNWYDRQVRIVQHGRGEQAPENPRTGESVAGPQTLSEAELAAQRIDLAAELRRRKLDEEWYRERSAHWERVEVPFLSAANWGGQPLHLRGNLEAFTEAASTSKWLEVHGLEHWTHFFTDYGVELQRAFFDHFLKGADNGWQDRPAVQLQVRHPGERFELRHEDEWPIARTRWTRLYLDAEGEALLGDAPTASASVEYDPLGDGVTFSWQVPEATEITGPMAAKLFISSETADADLFLVVRLFDQADEEVVFIGCVDPHTPIAQGWLRASHRRLDRERSTPEKPYHAHDRAEPLEPGQVYELDVEIWPSSIVAPAGHRLALTVRGRDYVYPGPADELATFANAMTGCGPFVHDEPGDRPRSVFGGRVTIHAGPATPSHLLLPIVPPKQAP